MRLVPFLFATICLATSLAATPLAHAQAPAAAPAQVSPASCTGSIGVVRVSEIKPGKMSVFLAAVEAQAAWYKTHGMPEHRIYSARISDRDEATGAVTLSETQAMTFHFNSTSGTMPPHDDGYAAFVNMYKDSSSIKSEYRVCTSKKL